MSETFVVDGVHLSSIAFSAALTVNSVGAHGVSVSTFYQSVVFE